MQNKLKATCCIFLIPLVLSGCFSGPNMKASKPIDPPQENYKPVQAAVQQKVEAKGYNTELYVFNQDGYVLPYTLKIPGKTLAKTSLEYLVEGGQAETLLPKGMKGILPKGTKVLGVKIENGVATVNFSKEFRQYKKENEAKMLSAITWTLTGFPKIKTVNLQIEGKPLTEMPKGKTAAQGLSRENGINVEVANGVDITQSMPVTLYFLSQSDDDSIQFIPVTRMVNRSSNLGETVLQELVKGPAEKSNLIGPLDASTVVKDVKVSGKLITANFGKEILQYNDQTSASKSALQAIVLSLTQNLNASKVKIMVDGKTTIGVISQSGKMVDLPINRPKQINPNGL